MEPQWSPKLSTADSANAFVDAVRVVGAEHHAKVVRRFELMHQWLDSGMIARANLIGPDGLHMTDAGYAMLAKAVLEEISAHSAVFRAKEEVPTALRR